MSQQSEDDNIPDHNEFVFIGDDYNPQLFMKMVANMSRSMNSMEISNGALAKQSLKTEQTMEKLADAMSELVLSHNDTKKDIEAMNARIDDRKEEIKKHTELFEKLFDKVESFDTELHTSCDIYNTRNIEYTDKAIAAAVSKTEGKVKIGWIISAVLLGVIGVLVGVIYHNLTDDIKMNDTHTRNVKIHGEHK